MPRRVQNRRIAQVLNRMISEYFGFRFALYALFLIFNMPLLSPILLELSTNKLTFIYFFVDTLIRDSDGVGIYLCVAWFTVPLGDLLIVNDDYCLHDRCEKKLITWSILVLKFFDQRKHLVFAGSSFNVNWWIKNFSVWSHASNVKNHIISFVDFLMFMYVL